MLDARMLIYDVSGTKRCNSKILLASKFERHFHKLEDIFLSKPKKKKSGNIAVMLPSFHAHLKMENPGNQKLM